MAPEVFEEKYSTKADVWSVGCVAVQMSTGIPPWKNLGLSNPVALFHHISRTAGPPEVDMHEVEDARDMADENRKFEQFKSFIARCFQRVPDKRPSAADLLDDLFFSADHSLSIDDQSEYLSLFSPGSTFARNYPSSPIDVNFSPIRPLMRRRNSIGAPSSALLSPPLPRSSHIRANRSPVTPIPDSTEWPTWARQKLLAEGPAFEEASDDQKTVQAQNLLDSLAYSDDSASLRGTSGSFSPLGSSALVGLKFINSLGASPIR